ncbi:MAG TPA: hypothetical protein VN577_14790 [Terriglobales bacterium]|nr:hypothetical protein [Terriglobales bacterium]
MREGWSGDDYVVLFSEDDLPSVAQRYGIADMLPGYRVIGLRGWDDFIIEDPKGGIFTVPTVPCDLKHIARFHPLDEDQLVADARFVGRVKWYVTPIAFGGPPSAPENIAWITHGQHADLVRWWNNKYRELSGPRASME